MFPTIEAAPVDGEINPMQPGAVAAAATTPDRGGKKTNLVMVDEDATVQLALRRINELRAEMGIGEGGECQPKTWADKRRINSLQYSNSWEWREALGGIFAYSNFSLNIAKRYARLMAAKTADDLVGTDPFFAAMPTTLGNPELAKDVEWYLQEELAVTKDAIAEAQKVALIVNEAVVKTAYVLDESHFIGAARVAVGPYRYLVGDQPVDTAAGDPVMTPRGNYIFAKDDIVPDGQVQNTFRLIKEPGFTFSDPFNFQDFDELDQKLTHKDGLDVRTLDWRDFLCPLNVASIHEADICVHLIDYEFDQLKAIYGGFEIADTYLGDHPLSGEKSAKEEHGELQETSSNELSIVHCAEVYMRTDADGDGRREEIWMVLDLKLKKPIWYDYLGNHMKKRPFEPLCGIERVPQRWYGVGVFEMLEHKQLYIDTQFNRVNFNSMKTGAVRFRNKGAVAQWKAGDEVVIGDDQILDIIDPRFTAQNPPLFKVDLTEINEHAMKLIELMMQAGMTEVGVVGPNDGDMSGLDSSKLATGIKSLERTGNQLMKFTEAEHGRAIIAILDQAVDTVLEHMDDKELVYREETDQLVELNREEIRTINKQIKLLLTRSRSTETIETARMVIQLVREYYEALTTYERYKLRPEYLRQLKALEVQDAGELLDEVSKEEADAWLQAQNQPQPEDAKYSIATKYDMLMRSEQVQVLIKEGITPASDAEVAAAKQEDLALEVAKVNAAAEARARNAPPKPSNGSKPNASKTASSSNGRTASKRVKADSRK